MIAHFAKVGEKVLAMRSAIGKTRERTNGQTYGASSFNALHVHACMRACVSAYACVCVMRVRFYVMYNSG